MCPSFILVFENNIQYVEYSVQARFTDLSGNPVWPLADVEYTVSSFFAPPPLLEVNYCWL